MVRLFKQELLNITGCHVLTLVRWDHRRMNSDELSVDKGDEVKKILSEQGDCWQVSHIMTAFWL